MAKGLFLAEKPDAMKEIKAVYDKEPSLLGGDTLEFAFFVGHVLEMAPPDHYEPKYKKWSLADLPIIPDPFEYVPANNDVIAKILDKIKYGHYDFIVNGCDTDREGERIFNSFYRHYKLKLPIKRFFSNDLAVDHIKHALSHLLDASEMANRLKAADLRAEFDWLIGMNYSRAVSLLSDSNAYLGRVITPTLKLIVDREWEIRNFVAEDFYEISAEFKTKSGEKYPGLFLVPPTHKTSRMSDKAVAQNFLDGIDASQAIVVSVQSKENAVAAPTLYSQTELQKDANKFFRMKPDETLAVAQSLYTKKFTSYPRTKSRALSSAIAKTLDRNLAAIADIPELKAFAATVTPAKVAEIAGNKNYVCDAKVTEHHAIIPTFEKPDFSKMSDKEQKVYMLIARRFLSIFLPPYKTSNTVVVTSVHSGKLGQDLLFRSSGKVELDKGFTALYTAKPTGTELPKLAKGDIVDVAAKKLKESRTQPPARYSPQTLLDAMLNVGKTMTEKEMRSIMADVEGLGTESSRADTIKKLEERSMISLEKNFYHPTDFGMELIAQVGKFDFASAELTAKWEIALAEIEAGTYNGNFKTEMLKNLRDGLDAIMKAGIKSMHGLDNPLGVCPSCGGRVVEGKNFYFCEHYKPVSTRTPSDCDFVVGKSVFDTTISEKDIRLMLAGKQTAQKNLTFKSGSKTKAPLKLGTAKRKDGTDMFCILPAFAEKTEHSGKFDPKTLDKSRVLGTCPSCKKGQVYSGKSYYVCTAKGDSCDFALRKDFCGATLTDKDLRSMLAGGESEPHQFTWKSGKQSNAKIKFGPGGKLEFVFQ